MVSAPVWYSQGSTYRYACRIIHDASQKGMYWKRQNLKKICFAGNAEMKKISKVINQTCNT